MNLADTHASILKEISEAVFQHDSLAAAQESLTTLMQSPENSTRDSVFFYRKWVPNIPRTVWGLGFMLLLYLCSTITQRPNALMLLSDVLKANDAASRAVSIGLLLRALTIR